jgi:hypothetical protein
MSTESARKLGQLLVERGWITGEQLIRAIQSQRVVGGRIGTCLLEMDVLSEDQLLDALSIQQRIPAAGVERLRGVEDETLELLPAKLAAQSMTVPFESSRSEIKVATLNGRNLALLDEVSFCANRRVTPHVSSEIRILEALEKYYGVELPRRFGHLLDRLNRSRYLWDESAKVALGDRDEGGDFTWQTPEEAFEATSRIIVAPAARVPSPVFQPDLPALRTQEIPVLRPQPSSDAAPSAATAPGPTSDGSVGLGSMTLELVDRLLAAEQDGDRIAEIVLRFAGQRLSRILLFRLRQDKVVYWRGCAAALDESCLASLEISLQAPSAFLHLHQGAPHFTGPLAPMQAHRQLAQCWGGELPREVVLLPLKVRDRLVAIFYGDRGAMGLGGVDLEELKRLTAKASMALELTILRKKLHTV